MTRTKAHGEEDNKIEPEAESSLFYFWEKEYERRK
jgi:uncharacterized membrane protein